MRKYYYDHKKEIVADLVEKVIRTVFEATDRQTVSMQEIVDFVDANYYGNDLETVRKEVLFQMQSNVGDARDASGSPLVCQTEPIEGATITLLDSYDWSFRYVLRQFMFRWCDYETLEKFISVLESNHGRVSNRWFVNRRFFNKTNAWVKNYLVSLGVVIKEQNDSKWDFDWVLVDFSDS